MLLKTILQNSKQMVGMIDDVYSSLLKISSRGGNVYPLNELAQSILAAAQETLEMAYNEASSKSKPLEALLNDGTYSNLKIKWYLDYLIRLTQVFIDTDALPAENVQRVLRSNITYLNDVPSIQELITTKTQHVSAAKRQQLNKEQEIINEAIQQIKADPENEKQWMRYLKVAKLPSIAATKTTSTKTSTPSKAPAKADTVKSSPRQTPTGAFFPSIKPKTTHPASKSKTSKPRWR